jgi:hypothetical protein
MTLRSILLAAAIVCAAPSCAERNGTSAAIGRLARAGDAGALRLADAAPFAWDQVVLFAPYAPRAAVCASLRIAPASCEDAIPFESTSDADMSLAFLEQGRLVRYERHARRNGDLAAAPLGRPIAREEAVFRIVVDESGVDGRKWIRLPLRPGRATGFRAPIG